MPLASARQAKSLAERELSDAITVLESVGGKRLGKTYIKGLPEQSYDKAFLYTSETWVFHTIGGLAEILVKVASHPDKVVIRGAIKSEYDESEPHVRRLKDREDGHGAPYRDVPRIWFMADIDEADARGLSVFKEPQVLIKHVLEAKLPPELQGVDCIVQLSSSAGLIDKKSPDWRFGDGPTIGMHVFFMLDHPVTDQQLRDALKIWEFDAALAGAVQLHYTANPVFLKPRGFLDPDPIKDRIKDRWYLIKGKRRRVRLRDFPAQPHADGRGGRNGAEGAGRREKTAKATVRPKRPRKSRRSFRGMSFDERLTAIGQGGHHFEAAKSAVYFASMKFRDEEWPHLRRRIFARLDTTGSPEEYKGALDRYRIWCLDVRNSEQSWHDGIPEPAHDREFDQNVVENARARQEQDIDRWFAAVDQPSAFNALCLSSPGLGKTTAALKAAARRAFSIDFYVASHRDAEERQRQLAEFPPRRQAPVMFAGMKLQIDDLLKRPISVIERGRAAEDPKRRLGTSPLMCGRPEAFAAVLAAGVDAPRKVMCDQCSFRGDCGTYAQLEDIRRVRGGRGVVIAPHAYTIKQRRHHDGPAAVIDENATSQHWQREQGPKLEEIDPKVAKAIISDKPILSLIRRLGGRAKAASFLRSLRQKQPRPDREELSGRMPDGKIIEVSKKATTRTELRRLYTALLKAVEAGWSKADHIEIAKGRVWVHTFNESRLDLETPLLILDATARPELIEAVYQREFNTIGEQLAERLDITQVSTTGSKAALYQWSDDSDIADMAEQMAHFAKGKSCLAVVHKSHRGKWEKALTDNFHVVHFGDLRGTNEFAECDRAVIIGRQQPSPDVFIRQASALRLARGEPQLPSPPADLREAPSGYFYHPDTGREFHPDPIVEALRWSACEGEIIQAIARLRSSVQPIRKALLLVTNLSIPGLVPTRTIPLSRLRTAKPDLMRAAVNFMLNTFGGLVMTRASFEWHTDITAKSYRKDAFDVARERCVEVSFIKTYGQKRPSKALILTERVDKAQMIIQQIEGRQVVLRGSKSGRLAPKQAA